MTAIGTAATGILLACLASPAQGALFRAYLAMNGSDANPCTLAQPCRLLPAALAAVDSGGEIWMLDSANYNTGPVAVGKSVTILAVPGVLASVVAIGGYALQVTSPGIDVSVRNLDFRPIGTGFFGGLFVGTAARVTVQGCNFFGFTGVNALYVAGAGAFVSVTDSVFRGNGVGAAWWANAKGVVSGSQFFAGGTGLSVRATGNGHEPSVSVVRSVFAHNGVGVQADVDSPGAAKASVSLLESTLAANTFSGAHATVGNGIVGGQALVSVTRSLLAANARGLSAAGPGARVIADRNMATGGGVAVEAPAPAALATRQTNFREVDLAVIGAVQNLPGR